MKVRAVADPDRRVSAKQLALRLPKHAWRTIRDSSAASLRSRFTRVRVRSLRRRRTPAQLLSFTIAHLGHAFLEKTGAIEGDSITAH